MAALMQSTFTWSRGIIRKNRMSMKSSGHSTTQNGVFNSTQHMTHPSNVYFGFVHYSARRQAHLTLLGLYHVCLSIAQMTSWPSVKPIPILTCVGINWINDRTIFSHKAAPSQKIEQMERLVLSRKFHVPGQGGPPLSKRTTPEKVRKISKLQSIQRGNARDLMLRNQVASFPTAAPTVASDSLPQYPALGCWFSLDLDADNGEPAPNVTNTPSYAEHHESTEDVKVKAQDVAAPGPVVDSGAHRAQVGEVNPPAPPASAPSVAAPTPAPAVTRWVPPHRRGKPDAPAAISTSSRPEEAPLKSSEPQSASGPRADQAAKLEAEHPPLPPSVENTHTPAAAPPTPAPRTPRQAPGRWVPPHQRAKPTDPAPCPSSAEDLEREEAEIQERNDQQLRKTFVRNVQAQILAKEARYSAEYDGQSGVESWALRPGCNDVTVSRAGPYAIARRPKLGTTRSGEVQWGARTWEEVEPAPRSAFTVRFQREPAVRFFERASMIEVVGDHRSDKDPNYGFMAMERARRLEKCATRSLMTNIFKDWKDAMQH